MDNMSGSEDGQLRSPNDGHYISGDEEDHDADSLYIQPPQASTQRDSTGSRRKEKKHSRERRRKERERGEPNSAAEHRERYEYRREERVELERYHRSERVERSSGGGGGYATKHISVNAYHYHHQHHQPLPAPPSSQVYGHGHHGGHQHHHHGQPGMHLSGSRPSRGGGDYYQAAAYHGSRHEYVGAAELDPRRSKYNFEQPKDAESLEQDLRSRLLSKRHKYVKDYETEENYNASEQPQQQHRSRKERLRGEERALKAERHRHRHERADRGERGNIIEVLDSPEYTEHRRSKHSNRERKERAEAIEEIRRKSPEDPELIARRAKILAAERENRQRRKIAREELEARREMLRERNDHSDALSPSTVAASVTAGLNIVKRKQKADTYERDVKHKKRSKHSEDGEDDDEDDRAEDEELEEDESEESDSEEAESADSDSDSESGESDQSSHHKQAKTKPSKRKRIEEATKSDDEDVPLPDSPLSVGELYKSPKQKQRSKKAADQRRSRSRTRSHSALSSHSSRSGSPASHHGSESSRSKSASRSRSRSPASSLDDDDDDDEQHRSPSTSTRSEERGMTQAQDKPHEDMQEVEEKVSKASKAAQEDLPPCDEKGVPLPNYFPGVQGCRSVEEFQCLNRIEEGTYGVVYRAKDKRTNEIVALKRLKMEKEKEGFPITSLREINTLLKGQHPNIVTVREIVVGSNMDKIFIVMDYVEHDLKSLMETMKNRKQSFFPGEVKCLTQQLLLAVAHLHDNWILHRDLKTSNLLLSHKGILKVGDFGLAREYGSPLKKYTSLVVTLWYRAPELLLCSPEYSTPIDVWSVGCIFAEFLQMQPLFPGKSEIDELNLIFKELGTPNEKIWPGYHELPAVKNMLSQNSQFTDYPISKLRKHFQEKTSDVGLQLLQGLLTYDPKQRLTADAALKHQYFKELPLAIDPSMFPTWPAKSELGANRKTQASSPKPPSGGSQFKQLGRDEPAVATGGGAKLSSGIITGNKKSGANAVAAATAASTGFILNAGLTQRQLAMGSGFSLKF